MSARTAFAWLLVTACLPAATGCHRGSGKDLSVAQLSAVVAREQPSLEACYQEGLDRTPYDHEFRIQAKLAIRRDGSVEKVTLDQNGLQGLGPCVQKAILAWRFPQAEEDTLTSLPIVFRPKVEKVLPENLHLPPGFRVLSDDKQKAE